MNFRTLEYVSAVGRLRHFGKAARDCGISQPALSGQIRKFEEQLGFDIFDRSQKRVRVTGDGEAIIALAGRALEVINEMSAVAKAAKDPLAGEIRIGLIPTIAPYLIPGLAEVLTRNLPSAEVTYCEDVTDRLVESLAKRELDMIVTSTLTDQHEFSSVDLYEEPFFYAVHKDDRTASSTRLSAKDVPSDRLLLLTDDHCFRGQSMELFELAHQGRKPSVWATSIETLINMTAAGKGVAVVPALAVPEVTPKDCDVVYKAFKEKRARRIVRLSYRRSFRKSAQIKVVADSIRQAGSARMVTLL